MENITLERIISSSNLIND